VDGASWVIKTRDARADVTSPARIDRLVLLAGAVRVSDLTRGTGRSILDLPLAPRRSVFGQWCEEASRLVEWAGLTQLQVDVVLAPATDAPDVPPTSDSVRVYVRRDEASFRGTGGALRDIAATVGRHGVMLVANAGQILGEPLVSTTRRLVEAGADVAIVSHSDGTPSGVTLLSSRVLAGVNPVGFVDFKEQVLPSLRGRFDVRAVSFDRATGRPIRTLESYIGALREHHDAQRSPGALDPFAERWSPSFAVAEVGSEVAESARLHDSVVLAGGRVEADAVVVRSVVGPNGVVLRGQIVVDSVVSAESSRRGLGRIA